MSVYPRKVNDRFITAANAGSLDDISVRGTSASFVCGSFVTLSLRMGGDVSIEYASFRTNGCGFMVATADVISEWLREKSLTDLHGLNDAEMHRVIVDKLGDFPSDREQCALVVFEALRKALFDYRASRIREFKGDEALICTCFGVTEETIVEAISSKGVTDVVQIATIYRAGSGCGSCRLLIQELIDARGVE